MDQRQITQKKFGFKSLEGRCISINLKYDIALTSKILKAVKNININKYKFIK